MSAAPVLVHLQASAARIAPLQHEELPIGVPPLSYPELSFAFYGRQTERMLRRYLYSSMLVGRCPSILNEPLVRGWASSRPVRTFEDAVIFVLDMEASLARIPPSERLLLAKVILQEYSKEEVAVLLGIGVRGVEMRLHRALDRLSRILLDAGLLVFS